MLVAYCTEHSVVALALIRLFHCYIQSFVQPLLSVVGALNYAKIVIASLEPRCVQTNQIFRKMLLNVKCGNFLDFVDEFNADTITLIG
jgi:hypothetical protein